MSTNSKGGTIQTRCDKLHKLSLRIYYQEKHGVVNRLDATEISEDARETECHALFVEWPTPRIPVARTLREHECGNNRTICYHRRNEVRVVLRLRSRRGRRAQKPSCGERESEVHTVSESLWETEMRGRRPFATSILFALTIPLSLIVLRFPNTLAECAA